MSMLGIVGLSILIYLAISIAVEFKYSSVTVEIEKINKEHEELKRVVDMLRDEQIERNNLK